MRRLILGVMLACAAVSAEAADMIEKGPPVSKGADDLLLNATLSQPFTVFDQLLLSLDRKAREVAEDFQPEKNDFRPGSLSRNASSRVEYGKSIARTAITFELYVSGIDDPWRDVCATRVKAITGRLWLPSSRAWEASHARVFLSSLLGPQLLTADDVQLVNYKPFFDSIVVMLSFVVESEDRAKLLKFTGQCFWDNKTGQVSFREHKY